MAPPVLYPRALSTSGSPSTGSPTPEPSTPDESSHPTPPTLDDFLPSLGGFGPFQLRLFLLTSLPRILLPWAIFIAIFTAKTPADIEFRCASPDWLPNVTEPSPHSPPPPPALLPLLSRMISPPKSSVDSSPDPCFIYAPSDDQLQLFRQTWTKLLSSNTKTFSPPSPSPLSSAAASRSISSSISSSSSPPPINPEEVALRRCNRWIYGDESNSNKSLSYVSDFDLVCRKNLFSAFRPASVDRTTFWSGVLVGAVLTGWISDKYGRRFVLLASLTLFFFAGSFAGFAPNFWLYLSCRFFVGISFSGIVTTTVVLSVEWFDTRNRARFHILGGLFFSVGYVSIAGIAYFVRQWRFLQLLTSVPAILFLPYFWLIPESARWLLARRRWTEAAKLMQVAAERNGTSVSFTDLLGGEKPEDKNREAEKRGGGGGGGSTQSSPTSIYTVTISTTSLSTKPPLTPTYHTSSSTTLPPHSKTNYSFVDLFRLKSTRVPASVLSILWLITAVGYYGLSQNPADFGYSFSLHLKHFLFGLIEFPSRLLVLLLLHKTGRRVAHSLSFFVLSSSLFIVVVFKFVADSSSSPSPMDVAQTVFAVVGKFGASAAMTIVYLRSVEIYPTILRETGMGVNALCLRVGSILISVIPLLVGLKGDDFRWVTLGVALAAALAAGLTLVLPETRDENLKDRPAEEEGGKGGDGRREAGGRERARDLEGARGENGAAIIIKEGNFLYLS